MNLRLAVRSIALISIAIGLVIFFRLEFNAKNSHETSSSIKLFERNQHRSDEDGYPFSVDRSIARDEPDHARRRRQLRRHSNNLATLQQNNTARPSRSSSESTMRLKKAFRQQFEQIISNPLAGRSDQHLATEDIQNFLRVHQSRIRNEITRLEGESYPNGDWRRQQRDNLLNQQKARLGRIEQSMQKIADSSLPFIHRISRANLSSLNGMLDAIDYLAASPQEKLTFLERIYFPAIESMSMTEADQLEELLSGVNNTGFTRAQNLKQQMSLLQQDSQPIEELANQLKLASPTEPWINEVTRCLATEGHQSSVRNRLGQGWQNDFCKGQSEDRDSPDFCSNHSENFLARVGATRIIDRTQFPLKSAYDQRVSNSQTPKPPLQGLSYACVGMALAEELNHVAQPIFAGSGAQPFEGFQLYRQYATGGDLDKACGTSSQLENFKRAKKLKLGTDYPSLVTNLRTSPPCIELSHNRVRVGRISLLTADHEDGPPDFSFFERLIQTGQGAVAFLNTDIGLEQEDWVQYGCEAEIGHAVYVVGVGRGTSPFTNKTVEYVVVRDSLRNVSREYKVPLANFQGQLTGLMKVADLQYQDGEMLRSSRSTSDPQHVDPRPISTPAAQ